MFKRIFLFLLINVLVVSMVSLILNLLKIQPFLRSYGLDYQSLLIFCFIWGMVGALISLALSKVMAKWMLGVKVIHPNDPNFYGLYERVKRLSDKAGLPVVPEVGIFSMAAPNAFATGPTKRNSLVAVSTGLLEKLSDRELDAVIGHELGHIKSGDMVTMTLLQGVVNAFVMFLARVLAFFASGLGKSRDGSRSSGSGASYYLFVFLFEIVFMLLGSMVLAAYSRRREFKADYEGASLASRMGMISALCTLKKEARQTKIAPSLQAFMIHSDNPSLLMKLFSTHPPIEERVKKLEESTELA